MFGLLPMLNRRRRLNPNEHLRLDLLPDEIQDKVYSDLDPLSMGKLRQVSQSMKHRIDNLPLKNSKSSELPYNFDFRGLVGDQIGFLKADTIFPGIFSFGINIDKNNSRKSKFIQ
jgi:hypothetical protein